MRRFSLILSAAAVLFVLQAGCGDKERILPPSIVHTPLEFDPTEEYELSRWWSNGGHMLRLDEIGSYALYGDMNRYHDPIQRGRWSQKTYAVLRLEPYRQLPTEPRIVRIRKIEGELALLVPDEAPMFALPGPPRVIEDALLGRWSSNAGRLELREDSTYGFSPQPGVIMPGHEGAWRIVGDELLLEPKTPAVKPLRFTIDVTTEATRLVGPGDTLHRQ